MVTSDAGPPQESAAARASTGRTAAVKRKVTSAAGPPTGARESLVLGLCIYLECVQFLTFEACMCIENRTGVDPK